MAILDIVIEGDPRLRQKATRIRQVDDSIRSLADDMYETIPRGRGCRGRRPAGGRHPPPDRDPVHRSRTKTATRAGNHLPAGESRRSSGAMAARLAWRGA